MRERLHPLYRRVILLNFALILNEELVVLSLAVSSGTGRTLLPAPHAFSLHGVIKINVYSGLVTKKPRCLSTSSVTTQHWHKVPPSWVWRSWFILVTYSSSGSSGDTEMNQPALCCVLGVIPGVPRECLFPRTHFTHAGECWARAWWERVCSYKRGESIFGSWHRSWN